MVTGRAVTVAGIRSWPVDQDGWSVGPQGTRVSLPDGARLGPSRDGLCLGMEVFLKTNVRLGYGVQMGNDVFLEENVRLGDAVQIGNNVRLGENVHLGDAVQMGNNVRLEKNVHLGDAVTLGNTVRLGENALLEEGVNLGNTVFLGKNVHLGEGVVLGHNVDLGDGVNIPDAFSYLTVGPLGSRHTALVVTLNPVLLHTERRHCSLEEFRLAVEETYPDIDNPHRREYLWAVASIEGWLKMKGETP